MIETHHYERIDPAKEIARAVRDRRRLLHLSQEDVAVAAGVSVSFVRFVEHAKPSMRLDSLSKVLHTLGLALTVEQS